jgi:hypothetical protein
MERWLMNKLVLCGEEFIVTHIITPNGIEVDGVYDECPSCMKYLDDKRRFAPHYNYCMTCGTPLDEETIRVTKLNSLSELHNLLRKYEFFHEQKTLDDGPFIRYKTHIVKRIKVLTRRVTHEGNKETT